MYAFWSFINHIRDDRLAVRADDFQYRQIKIQIAQRSGRRLFARILRKVLEQAVEVMAQNKKKTASSQSLYTRITQRLYLTDSYGAPRFKATRWQLVRFSMYWALAATAIKVFLGPIADDTPWSYYGNPYRLNGIVMFGFLVALWFILQALLSTKSGPKWLPYYKRVRQKDYTKKEDKTRK